jgi:hypothetical protein
LFLSKDKLCRVIHLEKWSKRGEKVLLRKRGKPGIICDEMTGIAEVKIRYHNELTPAYQVKNSDLNLVPF